MTLDTEGIWKAIETERLNLADQLSELRDDQWEVRSLCEGWSVREVAAHLTLAARIRPLAAVRGVVRARGNFNRFVDEDAREHARLPTSELVDELRRLAPSRNQPPGTKPPDPLVDMLVHGQDIFRPLGIPRSMPREPAVAGAEHVWKRPIPFRAQKRCAGVRLRATNADLELGEGPEAAGPIEGVLLTLTGRPAGLDDLSGPGVDVLRSRLRPSRR
jgi:uncharacterized protein (TIGR03083 family)